MDPLTDVLDSLRLAGSVYCRTELTAPWGMRVPTAAIAYFHLVRRGRCWAALDGADENSGIWLAPGDLLVVPHGSPHAIADAPGTPLQPFEQMIERHAPDSFPLTRHGGGGAATELLCGEFHLERRDHPLLTLLPPLLVLPGVDGMPAPALAPVLTLLADEVEHSRPGIHTVVTRLVDVLFVQVVRAWLAQQPDDAGGWLGALRDRRIGEALAAIHREPGAGWSVASLAAVASMSRSAFAARFAALVGEGPLAYLARWRMLLAARWLRDGELTVAEMAARLGYQTEAAFGKAFKRRYGVAPGRYRRQESAA